MAYKTQGPCPDGRLTWRVIETQARPLGGGDIGAEKLSWRNVTGRGYDRASLRYEVPGDRAAGGVGEGQRPEDVEPIRTRLSLM